MFWTKCFSKKRIGHIKLHLLTLIVHKVRISQSNVTSLKIKPWSSGDKNSQYAYFLPMRNTCSPWRRLVLQTEILGNSLLHTFFTLCFSFSVSFFNCCEDQSFHIYVYVFNSGASGFLEVHCMQNDNIVAVKKHLTEFLCLLVLATIGIGHFDLKLFSVKEKVENYHIITQQQ